MTPTPTPTPTPTRAPTSNTVNQAAPSNSKLIVSDSVAKNYLVGDSLIFNDGNVGKITSINFDTFTNYIENFFTEPTKEGAEVMFSVVTPTPTATPTMTATPTPTMTITPTPTPTPTPTKTLYSNKVSCDATNNPASSSSFNKASTLYISDCVGYKINDALFKNGTLMIELDTDDETLLYSGYYKLVI